MEVTTRVAELKAKADDGTITEDEFVEYLRLAGSRANEANARDMYQTSYAAKHRPGRGVSWVS